MQAIVTRYIGPTTARGGRVKAECMATRQKVAKPVTLSWDYAMGTDGNHCAAARALATSLNWEGYFVSGSLPEGTGDCFVRMGGDYYPPCVRDQWGGAGKQWFYVPAQEGK